MKYVLQFEAPTDKAACRAAESARTAYDGIQIAGLINLSYPDSAGRVLIGIGQPSSVEQGDFRKARGILWGVGKDIPAEELIPHVGDVYDEVRAERRHQDEKWGGEAHDDGHGAGDWLDIIDRLMAEYDHGGEDARKILVQIAAVAVAGIETRDRAAQRG